MKDRKNSSLLGHRLKFRWLFLFSLFAGPLPLSFGGQSAVAANNIIQQQKISVTGKVVDNLGEPIIGANVVVQGQTVGTITDIDGVFKLDVPKGAKLLISFIGYSSKTVEVKQSNIEIVLDDDSQMLGEVEVVAYGVQKKVSVTGAISSVKGEELTKTPTGSISNMLSGQMAGLTTVQYSGEPGSDAANIFVRGQATWNQSAPLIQVDGVERSMNDIDPNEIESISILKDASATAVFGVRGANGVVLITTKRGKEGKAKISFTTSSSIIAPTESMDVLKDASSTAIYGSRGANGVIIVTTKSGKEGKVVVNYNAFTSWKKMANTMPVLGASDYAKWQYELALLKNNGEADSYEKFFGNYFANKDVATAYELTNVKKYPEQGWRPVPDMK
jgi:TonB-dependent SusC/RagA subfamily outer membrane receptor